MNCIRKQLVKNHSKPLGSKKSGKPIRIMTEKVKLMISLHSGSNIREQHWRAIDQISKSTLTDRVYKRQ